MLMMIKPNKHFMVYWKSTKLGCLSLESGDLPLRIETISVQPSKTSNQTGYLIYYLHPISEAEETEFKQISQETELTEESRNLT